MYGFSDNFDCGGHPGAVITAVPVAVLLLLLAQKVGALSLAHLSPYIINDNLCTSPCLFRSMAALIHESCIKFLYDGQSYAF